MGNNDGLGQEDRQVCGKNTGGMIDRDERA